MSDELSAEILHVMGVLALRRDDEGAFRLVGGPPLWYVRLFPDHAADETVPPVERFPFLESFLPTAETFWAAGNPGRIRSGFWLETLGEEQEIPLEASAAVTGDAHLLLVEHVRSDYQRIQGILQKARAKGLDAQQAESYQDSLQAARARHRALLGAVPGLVLRLRRDGTVLEGGNSARIDPPLPLAQVVAPDVAHRLLAGAVEALGTGRVAAFACGEGQQVVVAPISGDEFWALLP